MENPHHNHIFKYCNGNVYDEYTRLVFLFLLWECTAFCPLWRGPVEIRRVKLVKVALFTDTEPASLNLRFILTGASDGLIQIAWSLCDCFSLPLEIKKSSQGQFELVILTFTS